MNKNEIKTDKIKKGLKCFSAVGSKISCSDCPYRYRFNDLSEEAFAIITEQEKEIQQLTRELAKEQEACVECDLERSWVLFVRDKEIDRLRAEIERLTEEHNRHKVVVKEFAEKLKQAISDNTYPYFDKNGKPVNIFNTDGFNKIDELLKEYEE